MKIAMRISLIILLLLVSTSVSSAENRIGLLPMEVSKTLQVGKPDPLQKRIRSWLVHHLKSVQVQIVDDEEIREVRRLAAKTPCQSVIQCHAEIAHGARLTRFLVSRLKRDGLAVVLEVEIWRRENLEREIHFELSGKTRADLDGLIGHALGKALRALPVYSKPKVVQTKPEDTKLVPKKIEGSDSGLGHEAP